MAAPWQLIQFENQVLLALREMDSLNWGAAPNFSVQFPKSLIDDQINQSIADLVMMSGYQPRLTDRIVSAALTTVVDFALPTDCAGLQRVEYQQAPLVQTTVTSGAFTAGVRTVTLANMNNINVGSSLTFDTSGSGVQEAVIVQTITATTVTATFAFGHGANCVVASANVSPYPLIQRTPAEFDRESGTSYFGNTVTLGGLPTIFREPIANCIRFYPQIAPAQVSNGDTIIWTYSSYGLTLVNNTDVANIPVGFQRGIVYGAAKDLWLVKGDEAQADKYETRFEKWCAEARKYHWNLPQAGNFAIQDEAIALGDPYGPLQW